MGGVVITLVCAVTLVWVPGLALIEWVLPGWSRLATLAVAPGVSIGLLFAFATSCDLLGVRVEWQTVALPVLVVAVAALAWSWRTRPVRRPRPNVSHIPLVVSVALASWLWAHAIGSPLAVPPYDDGANAGIFIHRIVLLGTLHPDAIIATDLSSGSGGVAFYPLGLHLVSALIVQITGVGVELAFQVVVATLACAALPIGAFVLTRRLVGLSPRVAVDSDVAAGTAAVVMAVLPGLPWTNLPWGGLALVAGVALMPAVLIPAAALPKHGARAGLLLAAAVAGAFAVHSSEVVSAIVIGAPMVVAVAVGTRARWRRVLAGLAVALGGTLVLLFPVMSYLGGGLAERTGHSPARATDSVKAMHDAWFSLVSAAQVTGHWGHVQFWLVVGVSILLAVGVWASRRSGVLLALLGGSAFLAVLAWSCLRDNATALGLATPWYSNGYRIMSTLAVPLAVFVGIGVAGFVALRVRVVAVVALAAAASLVAVPAAALSAVLGEGTYYYYSVVTASDRESYAWLGAHVRPGERVLNDSFDGSMWMYPIADVAPMFGPKSDLWKSVQWQERWYLLDHAAQMATDSHERALAAKYRVRYIAVGDRVIGGLTRQLDPKALAASPALRIVFSSGDAQVFEILPVGTYATRG